MKNRDRLLKESKERNAKWYPANRADILERAKARRSRPDVKLKIRDCSLRKKYGITLNEYNEILASQGGVCKICGATEKSRSLAVDHEHVAGFKKMPPEEKRRYLRGITCFQCNWIMLSRGVTLEKAKGLVRYLEAYEARKKKYDTRRRISG